MAVWTGRFTSMSQVAAGTEKADPLRQQLDELDQLMERMLALGVQSAPQEPRLENTQRSAANPAKFETPAEQAAEVALPFPAVLDLPVETLYHPGFALNLSPEEPAVTSVTHANPSAEPEPEPVSELVLPAPTFV